MKDVKDMEENFGCFRSIVDVVPPMAEHGTDILDVHHLVACDVIPAGGPTGHGIVRNHGDHVEDVGDQVLVEIRRHGRRYYGEHNAVARRGYGEVDLRWRTRGHEEDWAATWWR